MEVRFTRTANAGGVLELDGVSILLDGVSEQNGDYLPTPPALRDSLAGKSFDLIAFTHSHPDHFSPDFIRRYGGTRKMPPLLGPRTVASALGEFPVLDGPVRVGDVEITPVPSRHMGDAKRHIAHWSFLIQGSRRVWFLGDATPTQWRGREELPPPDILLAPFPYAGTDAAWKLTAALSPRAVVLLHLPLPEADSAGLCPPVRAVAASHPEANILIPRMGETVIL